MKFRFDINALRALAVTAVIFFHYKIDFISGGFVGVDVFFVISGYLMTSIIMGRLAKGSFSIWGFYNDRARRIIPGLLGVCFVLLTAGYFFVEPATYLYIGSTSISALLFFSNFRFWQATGYFDPQSTAKWLLHTWSLSVEWQFYMIYPLLIMALTRYEKTRRHILPILWSLAGASLLLCIYYSKAGPASAFYMLPQRAWELLAGGIVALQFKNEAQKYSNILLYSGLILIFGSLIFYDQYMPWPYYWGLAPVLGTCFVIAANRPDAGLFKNRLVQTIGLWSYSIYLWHWPVAVAAVYCGYTRTTALKILCELAILAGIIGFGGLALAGLKRLTEYVLAGQALRRAQGLLAGAGALALTVGFAIAVTVTQGMPDRRSDVGSPKLEVYRAAALDWSYPDQCSGPDPQGQLRPCHLGPDNGSGIFVLGDSYAMQIYSRFAEYAKSNPAESFTFLTTAACPPLTGIHIVHDRFRCNDFVDRALHYAETKNYKTIVLVSKWDAYFHFPNHHICFIEGGDPCALTQEKSWFNAHVDAAFDSLRRRLLVLKERGIQIVIVGATPSSNWDVPVELAKRRFLGSDTREVEYIDRDLFEKDYAPVKQRLISLASSVDAKFVDPLLYLCEDRRCPTVDKDGVPYYRDDGHYRSNAVKTSRFQFLDEAMGINSRLSSSRVPRENTAWIANQGAPGGPVTQTP